MPTFILTTETERLTLFSTSRAEVLAWAKSCGLTVKRLGVCRGTTDDRRYLIDHGALCAFIDGRDVWAIGEYVLGSAKDTAEIARRLQNDATCREVEFLGRNGCTFTNARGWETGDGKPLGRTVEEACDALFMIIE